MSSLSTNSSTSSSLYATASSSKRMSGLMSGLDTDELVKQLTSGTQTKINTANQKKQVASWQQEAYQAVLKSVVEFQSKYLSSASSSSSILNSNFFNSTSIQNNFSSYVGISGLSNIANNMKIKSISRLASQASFTASNKVSSQAIQTGTVKAQWEKSAVTGASMKISFENKEYTLSVGSDGKTTKAAEIVQQLNQQLEDQGLSDKLSAAIVGNKFVLQNLDSSSTSKATIKSASEALLNGFGLKADDSGTTITGSTEVNEGYFTNHSITTGSKLNLKVGDKEYTFTVPSSISLSVGTEDPLYYKELETSLNDSLKTNSDLAKKVKFTIDTTGNVSLTSTDGSTVSVTGGSNNLLNGLGLINDDTYSTTGKVDKTALYKSYLGESLSGANLTFDLNGLSKTISFNESEIASFNNVNDLQTYLDAKLKNAYGVNTDGSNKVKVSVDNGVLSFKTMQSSTEQSTTDVLTLSSSSKSGVLGMDGALHVYAGESNRINLNKTLRDVQSEFGSASALTASSNGTYDITVNGKAFSFKATDNLNTVMKTINNDADANVTISYSSTLDRFSIIANNGGANSKIDIHDTTSAENTSITESSNLTDILFGTSTVAGTGGKDAEIEVSFDNGQSYQTISRSSNTFTMDGVNFELKKVTTASDSGITKDNPITFSVESKTDDLVTKIKGFIDDYNAILTTVNGYISEKKPTDSVYKPLTDDQKTDMSESQISAWDKKAKQGLLFNDSLLSNFAQEWRHNMTDVVSSMSTALYQIGIQSTSYSDNGKLTVNEDTLKKVLNDDPDKVTQLFTSTDGIATRMQSVLKKYTNDSLVDTGLFVSKAGSSTSKVDQSDLAKKMKDYDTQIKSLKTRLKSQQEYYYKKFTALETYISKMNSQASFFSQNSSS